MGCGALGDFVRRCARHLREDVEHGHDDLRLFFARRLQNAESAEQQRADDDQRGEFGIDEGMRDAARQAERMRRLRDVIGRLWFLSIHLLGLDAFATQIKFSGLGYDEFSILQTRQHFDG